LVLKDVTATSANVLPKLTSRYCDLTNGTLLMNRYT